jgi:uncharacterized protein
MRHKNLASDMAEVVDIVAAAEGSLVGRTRLQKTACLLAISGLCENFSFVYKHYGPFSQELADATEMATLFSDLTEVQRQTQWGSTFSIFSTATQSSTEKGSARQSIIAIANAADAIELELATTAAFLATQGFHNPWEETASRKPEKVVGGRIERAKVLYARLREIGTPTAFPAI